MNDHVESTEQRNLRAVQQDGLAIQRIKDPSEVVQLAAVQQDGQALEYIDNPSEAVQLAAVCEYASAVEYIDNPSEAVQLAAVEQFGQAIKFIQNPSMAVQLAAVQNYAWSIQFIKNPSEELQLAAVTKDGLTIQGIEKPSEAVQSAAIQQDWLAIHYIKNPSSEIQMAAFSFGGGFRAAGAWSEPSRFSASDLTKAIQNSGVPFKTNPPECDRKTDPSAYELYESGLKSVRSLLINQLSSDILDLAAVAPELFDPPALLDILRDALMQRAEPSRAATAPRSI